MRNLCLWSLFFFLALHPKLEAKTLKVVATTPDLAWLASEMLQDQGSPDLTEWIRRRSCCRRGTKFHTGSC